MLVAIPCFYYIEVANDAEGAYEAELLRVAWDGEAPIPDHRMLKPDMQGRIFSMHSFEPTVDTPSYKVILDAERKEGDTTFIPDATLMAITGQHEQTVKARNRFEAEQLAVQEFFSFFEGSQALVLKITSVRMD